MSACCTWYRLMKMLSARLNMRQHGAEQHSGRAVGRSASPYSTFPSQHWPHRLLHLFQLSPYFIGKQWFDLPTALKVPFSNCGCFTGLTPFLLRTSRCSLAASTEKLREAASAHTFTSTCTSPCMHQPGSPEEQKCGKLMETEATQWINLDCLLRTRDQKMRVGRGAKIKHQIKC